MTVYDLILFFLFVDIIISINAGFYLTVGYRTRLARWGGAILFSQAIELVFYLLQVTNLAPRANHFFYLAQVFCYSGFCIFWLMFMFVFTRHTRWIRPRNVALVVVVPIIYFFMMIANWIGGPAIQYQGGMIAGSMMVSPYITGLTGAIFALYQYSVVFFSIIVMVKFFAGSGSIYRRLILPYLFGNLVMVATGTMELRGINLLQTLSIQQVGLSGISVLAFWVVIDFALRGMLFSAREQVVDQMQDGVMILDLDDRVADVNGAMQAIIKVDHKHAVKQHLAEIWPQGASLVPGRSADVTIHEAAIKVDGVVFTFDINTTRLFDAYHQSTGRVIVLHNVTGRDQMEKSLKEHARELQRANAFMGALAEVNLNLQSSVDPAQITTILGTELHKLGLVCFVTQIEPLTNQLVVTYLSALPDMTARIEKIIRGRVIGYPLDRKMFAALYRILETKEVSFKPYQTGDLESQPGLMSLTLLGQLVQFAGLDNGEPALVLPLVAGDQRLGVMGVWGGDLGLADIPPFTIFASQVANVMERAILFREEVKRSSELSRSNAMIIALSRVAVRLDATSDLPKVLETLGAELKKVRIHCMVGTLDDTKQLMKIEYISLLPDIYDWATRLGVALPKEITIPRRLWPTDKAVTEKAPFWDGDPVGSASKMLPFVSRAIIAKTFEMAEMQPEDQVCYLPMISEEDVIGILAVWGPALKHEDIPGLTVFANQVATAIRNARLYDQAQREIIVRTRAETRAREALNEKEILLKEVHHRVKNNLQVISSLLNLQASQISDPVTVDILRESQNRVRSMALIHEKLYQSTDLTHVDFAGYLRSLVSSLAQTYRVNSEKVKINVRAEKIDLAIDTALPCGLIVNELVSNSLKYGYPGEAGGTIEVSCYPANEGTWILSVSDDGVGLPNGLDAFNSPSLGLKLVSNLVKQIEGNLKVEVKNGTRFLIQFSGI